MGTVMVGTCADQVEFRGDINGSIHVPFTDQCETGVLLMCSDATVIHAQLKSPSPSELLWSFEVLKHGSLLSHIEGPDCIDNDDQRYMHSERIVFSDGLRWAYCGYLWAPVDGPTRLPVIET